MARNPESQGSGSFRPAEDRAAGAELAPATRRQGGRGAETAFLLPETLQRIAVALRPRTVMAPVEPPATIAADGAIVRAPLPAADAAIGEWRAFAGFSVSFLACDEPQVADLERQGQVLGFWLALPATRQWSIQLRLLVQPRAGSQESADPAAPGASPPDGPTDLLSAFLICTASAPSQDSAAGAVRELAATVALGGPFLAPTHELLPITELPALMAALDPFIADDVVEIGRQRDVVGIGGERISVPVRVPLRASPQHWLCAALVAEAIRADRPFLWAVTLESAEDVESVRALLHETMAQQHAALHHLAGAAPSDHQTLVAVVERAQQTNQIGQTMALHWQALAGPAGRVQAFLATSGRRVPPALVAAAIAECSDPAGQWEAGAVAPAAWWRAARPQERALAVQALSQAECISWESACGSRGAAVAATCGSAPLPGAGARQQDSPVHLAGVQQVAALFRLPVAGPTGLPGLYIPRAPREVWLPDLPAAGQPDLLLGENVARRLSQPVTIGLDDRRRHTYVVGQTGTGKSTLLLNCIDQDLRAGRGLAVLDPHGDLIEQILSIVPPSRAGDVVLVDPSDREQPVGFNFLEWTHEDERDQIVESFIGMLYQMFDPNHMGIVGPRFNHAARNGMMTAMSVPGLTLVEVVRILTDEAFVRNLLPRITDPVVRRYWTDQIARTSDFHKSEVLDYVVSKFSPFVNNRLVRNIIGQSKSTFSPRQIMDEGKVLLVNLAQGLLGQEISRFLGSVLVPKLLLAAFSRVAIPERLRRDFALYVDEFQHYATPAFVDIISGARKYRLNITMAHQHVGQLPPDVRKAILGNVGTLVAFRVGLEDALLLAGAMQPSAFEPADYIELPNYRAIAQVLSAGRRTPCFTLAARPSPSVESDASAKWAAAVRAGARKRHGVPRAHVEAEIARRAEL